jgi:hypothetical protein
MPAPRLVAGVVFTAAMQWGSVEAVGVAFEHRGRTWAIHRPVASSGGFFVSDALTGRRVPDVECTTVEDARAIATATIDSIDATRWAKEFGAE